MKTAIFIIGLIGYLMVSCESYNHKSSNHQFKKNRSIASPLSSDGCPHIFNSYYNNYYSADYCAGFRDGYESATSDAYNSYYGSAYGSSYGYYDGYYRSYSGYYGGYYKKESGMTRLLRVIFEK